MSAEPRHPWLVLIGLSFGVCVTNGFARFAYGLILPAMKAELHWTYAQAGAFSLIQPCNAAALTIEYSPLTL